MELSVDWIYLVIILGAALFSFIKKNFEKASQGNDDEQKGNTTIPESPIPPIVFGPRNREQQSKMEQRKKRISKPSDVAPKESRRPEFVPSTPPKEDPSPITMGEIGSISKEERHPLAPDMSDGESVRKGIIFSEVFRPKFVEQR